MQQIFPFELEPRLEFQNGQHVIVTALDRRVMYINLLSIQLRHHPIVEMMERCLSDSPLDRPTASELECCLDLMAQVCCYLPCESIVFVMIYLQIMGASLSEPHTDEYND